MTIYDLAIIGGGAAGLGAAMAAVQRRASVVIVEEGRLGGDCTFTGCVPSKTLIAAARRGASFEEAMAAVHAAVERIAATEDDDALRRDGVAVVHGRAALTAVGELDVNGRTVKARHVVIASGARAAVPPVEGLAELEPLTNETLFDLRHLPDHLAVLGGGAIGCEMAQAFRRLGSRVTVLEMADRLLPGNEAAASAVLADVFGREGIDVHTGVRVTKAERTGTGVRLHVEGSLGPVDADQVLVAAGRTPNTAGLGLERVGVELDERGFVRTDDHLATTVDGVWAIGDVTGRLQLTHAAHEMGWVAVTNALGRRKRTFDARLIPSVVYTQPEVASIGVDEHTAAGLGGRVAFLPMDDVDRAITEGATDGFVQLIAGPRRLLRNLGGGQVLGATIVSERAGEMINEVALLMRLRAFTGRLAQTVHAYPTWGLALRRAAFQFFDEVGGRTARPARRRPHQP